MNKLIIVIGILLVIGVTYNIAEAGEVPTKIELCYNLDTNQAEEAIGFGKATGIKGLEVDLLMTSNVGTTLSNDNKGVLLGTSYNYNLNPKLAVNLGAGLELKRFESFNNGETGEVDKIIYGGLKYLF